MTYRNREHLAALAERCEAGAEQLTYEAEHAAEVLAERDYPDADPQQWAAHKRAAAAAARQYAEGLRAEAGSMSAFDRPSDERLRQAEKVASAAELGGILIDGSRLAEAAVNNTLPSQDALRQAIWDDYQAKRDAVEGSGLFEHVAEEGQVPYWQLGHADQAQDTAEASHDDADEA